MTARISQPLRLLGKIVLTVVPIAISFAVIIPNCIVAATPSHPAHFAWYGLIIALLISSFCVYCVSFCR